MKFVLTYRLLISVIISYLAYKAWFFMRMDYETFITFLQANFNQDFIGDKFRSFVSIQRYNQVQHFSWLFGLLLVGLGVVAYFIENKIISFLNEVKLLITQSFNDFSRLSTSHKAVFFAIVAIGIMHSGYYIVTIPILYDEAWNFLYLIHPDFMITSLIHNSGPISTHIPKLLYSIGFSEWLSLRLPGFLFYILSFYFIFIFLTKIFSPNASLVMLAWWLFQPCNVLYSVWGRQYYYMNVVGLLLLILLHYIARNGFSKHTWVLYLVFSFIGFYASYLFIVPYAVLNIGFIWQVYNSNNAKDYIVANLKVALACIIIYFLSFGSFMIMLKTGKMVHTTLGNNINSISEFIHAHYRYTGAPMEGMLYFVIISILFLVAFIVIINQKKQDWLVMITVAFILFITPCINFIFFDKPLIERLSIYSSIGECFAVFWFIQQIYSKSKRSLISFIIAFLFVVFGMFRYYFFYERKWSYNADFTAFKTFELMENSPSNTSLYTTSGFIVPNLLYYNLTKHKKFNIDYKNKQSVHYDNDKPLQDYDAIIYHKKDTSLQMNNFQKVYENEVYIILKKNK